MQTIIQAVSSFGGQTMRRLLSVSGTVLLLSSSAFSDTTTPATIPPDGEFYDRAAIERCTKEAEVYFGWEGEVEWEAQAALAFWNEYRSVQMITARGEHPEGIVWADCAISETGSIVVYDFAPGPYNPPTEPPELLTP